MINNFLEQELKIKQYDIKLYNHWKDNLTYEVILKSWNSFIVQEMLSNKSEKNLKFIDEIISYVYNDEKIIFAGRYLDERFIKYNWRLFHVMKKINWKTIREEDIDSNIIEKTAEYVAIFHNKINNFNWKNYEEINYYKQMHNYRLEVKESLEKEFDNEINEIFSKMNIIAIPLNENLSLPKWVIHWDPSFKNFLINDNKNIVWLIDYDMLSVNNYIWDLADIIRSYMKIEKFQKKEFKLLINSYNSIRKLTTDEEEELKNYCTMMILDTWFRYLLSCFESNNQKNLLWDKNDSLKKANRCLLEIEKLNSFY